MHRAAFRGAYAWRDVHKQEAQKGSPLLLMRMLREQAGVCGIFSWEKKLFSHSETLDQMPYVLLNCFHSSLLFLYLSMTMDSVIISVNAGCKI